MSPRVSISLKAARTLFELLRGKEVEGAENCDAVVQLASALSRATRASATRRKLKQPKAAKKRSKREETSAIYKAVAKRAEGCCEGCGGPFVPGIRVRMDDGFHSKEGGLSLPPEVADVLSGDAKGRRPNVEVTCVICGTKRWLYHRPSRRMPETCSKRCGTKLGASRRGEYPSGSAHHSWKGDQATARSGRSRALRWYRTVKPCERCGSERAERHHRDHNTLNNEPTNIAFLCRKCHAAEHGGFFGGSHIP